jgi:hypothetical protein
MSSSTEDRSRIDAWVPKQRTRDAQAFAPGVAPAGAPGETDIDAAIAAVIRCWLAEDEN